MMTLESHNHVTKVTAKRLDKLSDVGQNSLDNIELYE